MNGEDADQCNHCEGQRLLEKVGTGLLPDPAVPVLDVHPQEMTSDS